jgi:uncharacterized protein YjbK
MKLKYHVYLNAKEYSRIMKALMFEKNLLFQTGHYTDGVDELLIKLSRSKIRKVKIENIY